MKLRRTRMTVIFRLLTAISVLAGILLTTTGPATVTGLLPYFTIQSNVAVGLAAGYAGWLAWRGRPAPAPALTGAVTLYITITGVVYHLVLANPASPFAGPQPDRDLADAVGNQFLHTVVPVLALLDWLFLTPRGRLRLRHAGYWLAFPLGYLGFALLRGLVVDHYPYPFVDADQLGYDGVAISAACFAGAFWLLGLAFVGLDRGLGRRGGAAAPAGTGGPDRSGAATADHGTAATPDHGTAAMPDRTVSGSAPAP